MGLSRTLIYTSELILCSTICVPSATRHNIHLKENKSGRDSSFIWPLKDTSKSGIGSITSPRQ